MQDKRKDQVWRWGLKLALVLDGKARSFGNSEDALLATAGAFVVRAVSAREGKLSVVIGHDSATSNSVSEDWIQDYEQAIGETVSFF